MVPRSRQAPHRHAPRSVSRSPAPRAPRAPRRRSRGARGPSPRGGRAVTLAADSRCGGGAPMHRTRRAFVGRVAGIAGVAAGGALPAACGASGATDSGGAGPAKVATPVTVRYLMWASTSAVEQAQSKHLADQLTARQPNLTVELTLGSAQFDDQLLAMYSGGAARHLAGVLGHLQGLRRQGPAVRPGAVHPAGPHGLRRHLPVPDERVPLPERHVRLAVRRRDGGAVLQQDAVPAGGPDGPERPGGAEAVGLRRPARRRALHDEAGRRRRRDAVGPGRDRLLAAVDLGGGRRAARRRPDGGLAGPAGAIEGMQFEADLYARLAWRR